MAMVFDAAVFAQAPAQPKGAQPPAKQEDEPAPAMAVPPNYRFATRGRRDPFVNPVPKPVAAAAVPAAARPPGLKGVLLSEATLTAVAKAAEVSPDSAAMLAIIGFSYINLNRIPQAIPPLQRAASLAPKDYLIQSELGYCLAMVGQTDAALDHLRKGASLNSGYGPVWEHLGLAYQKKGFHRDAVRSLLGGDVHGELGQRLVGEGELDLLPFRLRGVGRLEALHGKR